MKARNVGAKAVKIIDSTVNILVLTVILALSAFAVYALWDSQQIYQNADKANYAVYKPTAANQGKTFMELQAINPEVIAWLSVYGTHVDYPVTQGADNMKYVNTNAEGQYCLSGAIFLDSSNSKDFSDFNSILYGHHMEKMAMFGEIGAFAVQNIFDSHPYGNLYFGGKDHGLEFFAFLHTDAYDSEVFTAKVRGEARQAYLDGLLARAIYKRDIDVSVEDKIILLSTCSASSTNGRDILIGRITDEVFEDKTGPLTDGKEPLSLDTRIGGVLPVWLLLALLLVILIEIVVLIIQRRKLRKI